MVVTRTLWKGHGQHRSDKATEEGTLLLVTKGRMWHCWGGKDPMEEVTVATREGHGHCGGDRATTGGCGHGRYGEDPTEEVTVATTGGHGHRGGHRATAGGHGHGWYREDPWSR